MQSVTDTEVVANPFILASNNTKATVSIGEQRRIVTATVVGTSNQNAFDADDANLAVSVTPQINSDGMIALNVHVEYNQFTDTTNQNDATQIQRTIDTNAIVANKEVIALGGLIRDQVTNFETKVPILGDIPILGWFFKNKQKVVTTTSLLILISTRIIEPHEEKEIELFSNEHVNGYQQSIREMDDLYENRDPIYRMFFKDKINRAQKSAEGLIFERHDKEEEQKIFNKEEKAQLAKQQLEDEELNKEQPDTQKKIIPKETSEPEQDEQEKNEQSAHNTLIKAMHNKQRTQLSLANFLKNKEVRS